MALSTWAGNIPADVEGSPENFKIELTGAFWNRDSGGTLAGDGTTLDLVRDLGTVQQVHTFWGTLVFKPGRKHRIVVEGSPLHLNGNHTATQTFTYNGQQFTFSEPLTTTADLTYIFAGYQYDFLSGRAGHLGASVGGSYFDASGTITASQAGVTSTKSQQFGLPLAGVEFRVFPIPGHPIVDVNGGVRGMDLGNYGHYVEGSASGGIWLFRHLGLHAGYRVMQAYLQDNKASSGSLNVRLHGPIFSASFKW